jgi:hypothetical protein
LFYIYLNIDFILDLKYTYNLNILSLKY